MTILVHPKDPMSVETIAHPYTDHVEHKIPYEEWARRSKYPLLEDLDILINKSGNEEKLSFVVDIPVRPEAYRAEKSTNAVIICSDDRFWQTNLQELFHLQFPVRLIRIPGTVVGWTTEEFKQLVSELKSEGVRQVLVTSHEDCGAAKAKAAVEGIDNADEYAKKVVQDLINEDCGVENLGFIKKDDVEELKDTHPGLCLLVDATGSRNQEDDGQLPQEQFVLTSKYYQNKDLLKAHIKTLANIPLGGHGIGMPSINRMFGFMPDKPFYIFVSANNQADLDENVKYAEEAIEGINPKGVIRIVGFIVPNED